MQGCMLAIAWSMGLSFGINEKNPHSELAVARGVSDRKLSEGRRRLVGSDAQVARRCAAIKPGGSPWPA